MDETVRYAQKLTSIYAHIEQYHGKCHYIFNTDRKIFYIFAFGNHLYLTAHNSNLTDGTNIEAFEKNGGSGQEFILEKVEKIECIKTELVQKEGEKRLVPVNIKNSNYTMNVDYVVMATGSKPEGNVIRNFEKNKWGYINIDEKMQTSIPKAFAGGDVAGEKSTVAWAARSGRNAANNIIKFLQKK